MSWIKNASLVLASTAFALILAEIVLQFVADEDNTVEDMHTARLITNLPLHDFDHHFCTGPLARYMPNLVSRWREWPNSSFFRLRNDQANFFEHNDLGFRGGLVPQIGHTGVVVLGDSYTRGALADETETIPSFLSRWSTSHQFFNFGTGGHGTLQHAATYRDIKSRVEHDAVILISYVPNDLQDNVKFNDWVKAGKPLPQKEDESSLLEVEVSLFVEVKDSAKVFLRKFELGKLMSKAYRRIGGTQPGFRSSVPDGREIQLLDDSIDALTRQLDGRQLFVLTLPGRSEFESDRNWGRADPVGYGSHVRSALDQLSGAIEIGQGWESTTHGKVSEWGHHPPQLLTKAYRRARESRDKKG